MASIIPFKGISYNPDIVDNLSDVMTPPYDVISEKARQSYYERHPYNIIRLILGYAAESDIHHRRWHAKASETFTAWLKGGVLKQDSRPAFYLTSLEFSSAGRPIARYGLIALVGLEPFDKGIVLPHELTFTKVKSERLSLMKACHANFSPIFSLYSDRNEVLNKLKSAVDMSRPDLEFTDEADQLHRLWRIVDPAVHRWVSAEMADKKIFIADGHHRYETALSYREWMLQKQPAIHPNHPANYVMMYLSSLEDPGLMILPAHRIVGGLDERQITTFKAACEPYFNMQAFPIPNGQPGVALPALMSALRSKSQQNAMGVYAKGASEYLLLTLKENIMTATFGQTLSEALIDLDVVVLARLVFMEILGFNQERLDNEKLTRYASHEDEAVETVISGGFDMTFLLNPARIEQVRRIAEKGLIMPRKATYFYPKVITGTVINRLS